MYADPMRLLLAILIAVAGFAFTVPAFADGPSPTDGRPSKLLGNAGDTPLTVTETIQGVSYTFGPIPPHGSLVVYLDDDEFAQYKADQAAAAAAAAAEAAAQAAAAAAAAAAQPAPTAPAPSAPDPSAASSPTPTTTTTTTTADAPAAQPVIAPLVARALTTTLGFTVTLTSSTVCKINGAKTACPSLFRRLHGATVVVRLADGYASLVAIRTH